MFRDHQSVGMGQFSSAVDTRPCTPLRSDGTQANLRLRNEGYRASENED